MVAAEVFMLVSAVAVSIHAFSAWKTVQATRATAAGVLAAHVSLERTLENVAQFDAAPDLVADLSGQLGEIIEDTLGQMHVPTAADHLTGGVMQMAAAWFQSKMMKDMDPAQLAGVLGAVPGEQMPTESS
jgi:hypothetical protein